MVDSAAENWVVILAERVLGQAGTWAGAAWDQKPEARVVEEETWHRGQGVVATPWVIPLAFLQVMNSFLDRRFPGRLASAEKPLKGPRTVEELADVDWVRLARGLRRRDRREDCRDHGRPYTLRIGQLVSLAPFEP